MGIKDFSAVECLTLEQGLNIVKIKRLITYGTMEWSAVLF